MRGTPFVSLLLAVLLMAAASLLASPSAYADPNAPTVNVTFDSVNNGNSTPSCGQPFNSLGTFNFRQYRYGVPDGESNCPNENSEYLAQSGLGVEANSNTPLLTTCTSQIFQLGKAWHFNRVIRGGQYLSIPMTAAAWDVAYSGGVNGDINGTLTFAFTLDETDNNPDNHPGDECPYPTNDPTPNDNPVNANGCADAVNVVAGGVFTVLGGPTCSVEVLGFNNNCPANPTQGDLSTSFLSSETTNNFSCIYAKVTAPQAVALASFEATAVGEAVRLNWETASEVNNLGFNLWRGTTLDNRVQLNEELIPAQTPGNGQGAAYEVWDDGVGTGTYFYWLEDVDMNGNRTFHEPVSVTIDLPTTITLSTFTGTDAEVDGWWMVVGMVAFGIILLGLRRR
jgi:hypothetical protein